MVQFALNLAFTPTFFGAHDLRAALAVIVALAIVLAVTVWLFFKVRRAAGWLMVPYLAWVLFAGVLNYEFLRMNPDADAMDYDRGVQRIEF